MFRLWEVHIFTSFKCTYTVAGHSFGLILLEARQAPANDEWDHIVKQLADQDEWIIDGNYSRTLHFRLNKSNTVIYFDFPTYLCLYRVLKRRIQYHGKTRVDMGEGCEEKIDLPFLKWIWNIRRNNRPHLLKKLDEVKHKQSVVIFRHPSEVQNYLKILKLRS